MADAPEILVINLDGSPDRMAFMAGQLEALGLDFTRLPAATASSLSDADFVRLADTYMRPMTRSELACLTSHTLAWRRCVDGNRPVLVLEDDVFLSDRLPSFLADLSGLETPHIINIETRGQKKWVSKKPFETAADVSLYVLYIDRGGSAGYVVWPDAARRLLRQAEGHAAPSDAFINMCGIFRLQAEPGLASPVYDSGEGNGTIKPAFHTTIVQPSKSSRAAVALLRPHFKLRRLAGYMTITVRKLATIGVGIKRNIVACPTILAHADQVELLSHG
jgi:glycosyl transferase, family 25